MSPGFLKVGLRGALSTSVVVALSWATALVLGVQSLAFAVILQVLLMRWALYLLGVTRPALHGRWYLVKSWEAPFYNRLGVMQFRNLLRASGWERFRKDAQGFDGTRASLRLYGRMTREAEYSHLLLLSVCSVLIVVVSAQRGPRSVVWLVLSSVFCHLYPVLLQRTLRARLQRLGVTAGALPPD